MPTRRSSGARTRAGSLTGRPIRRAPTPARWRRSGPSRPGPRPGGAARSSMPEPDQVALEALGRFLGVEVGLGRQPLDLLATDDEHAVLAVDAEGIARPTRCGGRRRRPARAARPARRHRGAAPASRARSSARPSPSSRRRWPRPPRPGRGAAASKAGQASARLGPIHLVEGHEHRLAAAAPDRGPPARRGSRCSSTPGRDPSRRRRGRGPRPLDVAQEGVAQARAGAGALDEARARRRSSAAGIVRRPGPARPGWARAW